MSEKRVRERERERERENESERERERELHLDVVSGGIRFNLTVVLLLYMYIISSRISITCTAIKEL